MHRPRTPLLAPTTGRLLVALLLASAAGCTNDAGKDACVIEVGPTAFFRVVTPDCSTPSACETSYSWSVTGDATVLEVETGPNNSFSVLLDFTADATQVTVDIQLPEEVPLPLAEGDQLTGTVDVAALQWRAETVELSDLDGRLLVAASSAEMVPAGDLPETCSFDARECGDIGYPRVLVSHPDDDPANPSGPLDYVRQGGSSTLELDGVSYSVYVDEAWVWTDVKCTDQPAGWLDYVEVLRTDL